MQDQVKPAPKGRPGLMIGAIIIVVILLIGGIAYVYMRSGTKTDTDTIVYYSAENALSLDPADSYDTASFVPIVSIYDTLITFKGEDIGNYTPALATSWTVSPDGLCYNFTLREGVKFSNNDTFTAEDVKYSFNRILNIDYADIPGKTGVGWILSQDMDLSSTQVIDDYHVSIKLTRVYPGFLATMSQPMPAAIMSKTYVEPHNTTSDPYAHDFMKFNPMGTGPYKLVKWTKDVEVIMIKNDGYWGGWSGKHVTNVIIKETSEASTRIQALKSGDADISSIPLTNVMDVSGRKNIVVNPVRTFQMELIAMCTNTTRTDHAFMKNPLVRQALCYAFDYANTSKIYYNGYMNPVQGCIPNGMPLAAESQPYKGFTFDLRKASQLLNDSGYTLNAQNLRFDGTAIDYYVDLADTERGNTAVGYATNLQRIGIQVNLQRVSTSVLEDLRMTRNWDMYMSGWIIDYLDPDDYVVPIAVDLDNGGDYFQTGINNATINDAAFTASSTVDNATRIANYHVVWETLNADPNAVLIGQLDYVTFYRSWVHGFMFNPVLWYEFYNYYK